MNNRVTNHGITAAYKGRAKRWVPLARAPFLPNNEVSTFEFLYRLMHQGKIKQ